MQRPVTRRRRWPLVLVALLLTLAAAAAIVLSLRPFGARASGERLVRMQADPHFRDGASVNDLPPAIYTFADVRALLAGQFLVHWGTFNLAFYDRNEPILRASTAAAASQVEIMTPRIGEIVDADLPFRSTPWYLLRP